MKRGREARPKAIKSLIYKRSISAFLKDRPCLAPPEGDLDSPKLAACSVGIHCINCQSTVPEDKIEFHSLHCTTSVRGSVEGDFGILKSIKSFISFLEMSYSHNLSQVSPFVSAMRSIVDSPSNASNFLSQIQCISVEEDPNLQIYKERCHSLCQQLAKTVDHKDKFKTIKSKIDKIKGKHLVLGETNRRGKDELMEGLIASIEHAQASSLAFNSAHSTSKESSEKNPIREFYAVCMNAKLNLDADHPAQNIKIRSIYEDAMINNVRPEDWELFIAEVFKNSQDQDTIIESSTDANVQTPT